MIHSTANVKPTSCSVGSIVLIAGGVEYVCTSMIFSMALNSIPSVKVTVGCGSSLRGSGIAEQDPEKLLKLITDKHSSAYLDMIECKVQEVLTFKGAKVVTTLMEGVIVAGSPVYRAGTATTRMIDLLCMNNACKLYTKPLAGYINMSGAYLRKELHNAVGFDTDRIRKTAQGNSSLYALESIDPVRLLKGLPAEIQDATVGVRVAAIIGEIIEANTLSGKMPESPEGGKQVSTKGDVLKYIFSDWKINEKLLKGVSDFSFNLELIKILIQYLENASIYDSIQGSVMTNDFMLNMVPRWLAKDFKLELMPSESWDVSDPLELNESHIISIEPSYNPIASLNTPDAFVVNFSAAAQLESGDSTKIAGLGSKGFFAPNPAIMAYMSQEEPQESDLDDKLIRASRLDAPKWLIPSVMKGEYTKQTSTVKDKQKPTTSEKPSTENIKAAKTTDESVEELGNIIAQSFFAHLFGGHDKATLRVYPSLRFGLSPSVGCFEDHIGKAIDITFKTADGTADSPRNIRGILESIQYNYAAGDSSSLSYTLSLSCVRPLNKDEARVPCLLYTKD